MQTLGDDHLVVRQSGAVNLPLRRTAVGRMRAIEGARGIAAMMVVLMHAANLMAVDHFSGHVGLGGLFSFGYVGVDFFFVLSGFIISFVHFQDIGKPAQFVAYIKRRLFRIYPIYWFCLALTIIVLVAGRLALHKSLGIEFAAEDIAGTIFLLPVSEPKFVGVAWSLQFEIMFYAFFSVLIFSKRVGTVLFAGWFCAILIHLLVYPNATAIGGALSAYSLQFLFGVVTGITVSRRDFKWVGKAFLSAGVLCFGLAVYYERLLALAPHGAVGQVLLGLSAAIILFSLVELEKKNAIETPRLLYRLGSISYSVYLSHIIFINLIYSLLLKLGLYHRLAESLVYTIAVGGALVCVSLIGFTVELPFTRWARRFTASKAPRD